ncbi:futalosine hydrolase [Kitasatospora sp. NPDC002227]|uniref:futalosine hydrolase n=1 Tax=Kitasatospora sp. NPDC002227 TaxID=3154773 RepID=UPI00332E04AA
MTSPVHRRDDERPARVLVVVAVAAEAEAVQRGLRGGAEPHALPGGGELRRSRPASGVEVDVLAGGVGPAAVAATTATALLQSPYDLVVSAGIAGGFAPHAPVGSLVVATELVAADLGADAPEGFLTVEELGFGRSRHTPPPAAVSLAAAALGAAAGHPSDDAPGAAADQAAGDETATGAPAQRAAEGVAARGATDRPQPASAQRPRTVVTGPVLTVSTVTGSAERAAELAGRHPGAAAEAMEGFGVAEAAGRFGLPVLELRAVSNAVGPRDRSAWRIGEALAALEQAFRGLPLPELLEASRG